MYAHGVQTELSSLFELMEAGNIAIQEFNYLCRLSNCSLDFMYGVAHGLAYLLDPALLGQDLLSQKRRALQDKLIMTPDDDRKAALCGNSVVDMSEAAVSQEGDSSNIDNDTQ